MSIPTKTEKLNFIVENQNLSDSSYDFDDLYLMLVALKMSKEKSVYIDQKRLNYQLTYDENVQKFFDDEVFSRYRTWENYSKVKSIEWHFSHFSLNGDFEIKTGSLFNNNNCVSLIDYALDGGSVWVSNDTYTYSQREASGKYEHRGVQFQVFLNGKVKFKGLTKEQWDLIVDHHNMVNKRDYFLTKQFEYIVNRLRA
jgi:hypothetical protein